MPEYDYRCPACGHRFSVTKRLAEAGREERCPQCAAETKRVWSAPSVNTSACGSGGNHSFG